MFESLRRRSQRVRVTRPVKHCHEAGVEALESRALLTLLGQQLFPSDNPWNQNVASAPVAANSSAVMNNIISLYGNGHFHPDLGQDTGSSNPLYGIPFNVVHGNTQPKVRVVVGAYASESDVQNAPIPANAVLEGDNQNGPVSGLGNRGDSHLIVYDEDNNIAYEFYATSRPSENSDGQWHADQESVWNLNTNSFRTLGWTSADAAGLPILPGLLRPDEALPASQGGQGAINHAIRITLQNNTILDKFIYPASHVANSGTNAAVQVPMGTRLRLKSSVDISTLDPESQVVARAMQQYGVIVADNGSNFFATGASYSVDANNNRTLTWNDADINDSVHGLKSLTFSDFEVVNLAPVVTGLSASTGSAGTTLTVNGSGFSGAAGHLQVLFGTTAATQVNVLSDSQVSVVVPSGSGTVDVRVQSGVNTPDTQNINNPIFGYGTSAATTADRFTYGTGTTPLPTLSINNVSLTEGNSGTKNATFTVSLSAASAQSVTVNYATANGTATAGSDYTATSGTLTFAPGVTSQTINVPVIGDTVVEPDETFVVNLSSPTNATLAQSRGTGTILNDDSATASFAGSDGLTQGNWKGVYGTDGFDLAQDPSANNPSLPSYVASLSFNGAVPWAWSTASSDPRALQQAASTSTSRVAAGWFAATSFSIDVRMADANSHRLVLYALDFDSGGRAETISLVDDLTGQTLDSRSLSNFQNGVYLAWDVKGSVTIKVTCTAGPNALISGLFFGGSMPASATASFAGSDAVTQGNWKGVYGTDGFDLAQDPSVNNPSLPSYVASLSLNGAVPWAWSTASSDPRALQQAASTSTSRVAAGWFAATSFSIDVRMADANSHRLVLYALDFDSGGRAETISLIDDLTGQTLDSRSLSNFQNGVYLAWDVKGSVTIKVTCTAGSNALVSGLFFGGTLPASATATFAGSDAVTQGNWKGVYGAGGFDIVQDPSANNPSLPSYVASLSLNGAVPWAWSTASSDPRALQQAASTSTSRVAAGWFAATSFSIDVRMADANSHRLVLYALDFDSGGRAETISLVDDLTGQTLDSRSLSNFQNGVYLAWDVKGSVTIKVTCTAGSNALVSGLFFG